MPVLKFRTFKDLDRLERAGKGVNWRFAPDKDYLEKALRFQVRVPFPAGLYRFETFEDAEKWKMDWWIRDGSTKGTG